MLTTEQRIIEIGGLKAETHEAMFDAFGPDDQ